MQTINHNADSQENLAPQWCDSLTAINSIQFSNDDKKKDDDDQEAPNTDWGTVDPQEHPGRSSGMDPSGPGSAV